MDVILPKFLGQALAECPQTVLTGRESTSDHSTPKTSGRTGEKQSPTSTALIDSVLLESCYDFTRKGEGGDDVAFDATLNIVLGDVKEVLPNTMAGVPQCDTDFSLFRGGPLVLTDSLEEVCNVGVGVSVDGESSRLCE